MRTVMILLTYAIPHLVGLGVACGQLVQVCEDFLRDPGWDHFQNRIVGTDMPKVVQDFGWRRNAGSASSRSSCGC